MEALQEFGIQLIRAFQVLSPALDSLMDLFTFLGKVEFYLLFITFLYWIVDSSLGFRVFMVLLSTDIIGISLKQFFHQPRPYWISDVDHMSHIETSYGIPSTHASDSLSVWSYLACQMKKRWLWITAIVLMLLIAFSRLYLGVHFPLDVVGGWVIGLGILLLFIRFERKFSGWLKSKSTGYQLGFGFVISLLFIGIGLIISAIIAPTSDPTQWAQHSTEARTLTNYFTLGGAFFGAAAGFALMQVHARFNTLGSWQKKVGRYLVGIIGVLIAMYGLDAVFALLASDESILGYILRYIRYGSTTFWAMLGAPWAFLKLNLASS